MSESAAKSTIAAASLAACVVGLLGTDAGLVWIVAGVFTMRSLAGAAPGAAWAIACVGAGLRWGTLGVGDIETATRLLGSTMLAGATVVRVGMVTALAAAVLEEARGGGLFADSWLEQAAAVMAAVALALVFVVAGPTRFSTSVAPWAIAAAGAVAATVLLGPVARRIPGWAPICVAAAGIVVAEVMA